MPTERVEILCESGMSCFDQFHVGINLLGMYLQGVLSEDSWNTDDPYVYLSPEEARRIARELLRFAAMREER